MAITATNITLGYLGYQSFEAVPFTLTDPKFLNAADMVKLENVYIGLTTIYAWAVRQIVGDVSHVALKGGFPRLFFAFFGFSFVRFLPTFNGEQPHWFITAIRRLSKFQITGPINRVGGPSVFLSLVPPLVLSHTASPTNRMVECLGENNAVSSNDVSSVFSDYDVNTANAAINAAEGDDDNEES